MATMNPPLMSAVRRSSESQPARLGRFATGLALNVMKGSKPRSGMVDRDARRRRRGARGMVPQDHPRTGSELEAGRILHGGMRSQPVDRQLQAALQRRRGLP